MMSGQFRNFAMFFLLVGLFVCYSFVIDDVSVYFSIVIDDVIVAYHLVCLPNDWRHCMLLQASVTR